ncbi:MAG TPA: thymidine phosphorylase [Candidatus Onthousia excrementipullorum]|uniref:Pyrimidine-nucleoside phosphorylase n=1 Tax=Candidatus Onthousia excrementipullorum TaxID=2840884 RepID=A0A9D1DT85_9FIRM|nr:thymidine phosphorylase [Candidatus Onthousia excrementipullorum]
MLDIISKKANNYELTKEELETILLGYLNDEVKDYQMSAFLMAICINDMSDSEVFALTDIFIKSGDILDLSFIDKIKVDKHSTGGVGDKTTLIVAPLVASCGVPVIKMSGRGLGYTGGTIDKLESIPEFKVDLTEEEIKKQAQDIGIVITSQTKDLAPLDKKVYALRDVTATTNSIPLIASSIMSKKIAGGADKIVIDIKVGNGALIKTREEAERLSSLLIKIGTYYQKEVRTVISNMDRPLGHNIGNKLEVLEALEVLKGTVKGELLDLSVELATKMVSMGKGINEEEAMKEVKENLENGKALNKFLEFVKYQHGNIDELEVDAKVYNIKANKSGILKDINALSIAKLSESLGAGRKNKDDDIDYNAGVVIKKEIGDEIREGDVLASLYTNIDNPKFNLERIFEIS